MPRVASQVRRWLERFRRDQRGVSALEFALITPLLVLLMFGLSELSRALMLQRKVAHTASAVGDLVSQSTTLTRSGISDIFAAGSAIVAPFSTTPLQMRVSNVTVDKNSVPQLVWSRGSGLAALTAPPALPADLVSQPGDTVVVSEAKYLYSSSFDFQSSFGFSTIKNLQLSQTSYLKPRNLSVSCTDC